MRKRIIRGEVPRWGLSFDAFTAGTRPKIRPMRTENTTATRMAGTLSAVGVSMNFEMSCDMPMPPSTPSRPPIPVSTDASVRNCARMRRRFAPMAFFRPISRALRDGHEHDVHNADASHQQADARDDRDGQADGGEHLRHALHQALHAGGRGV